MNWTQFLFDLAKALAPFAVAAILAGAAQGARYLEARISHIRNRALRDALDWAISEADALVRDVVIACNQTVVNPVKQAGKWDATVAARVKQQAKDTVVRLLSEEAKRLLGQAVPDLTAWLDTQVERAVATAPNYTPAQAAPAS